MAESDNEVDMDEVEGEPSAPPPYELYMGVILPNDLPPPPPYEPPPVYFDEEFLKQQSDGDNQTSDAPNSSSFLGYVDFLPLCTKPSAGKLQEPQYEDFRTLVSKLNDWLRHNPHLEVFRCETIQKRFNMNSPLDSDTTTEIKPTYGATTIIRGLRAWLRLSSGGSSQEIYYVNVEPKAIAKEVYMTRFTGHRRRMALGMGVGMTTKATIYPDFEDVDETLAKVNKKLKEEPLPGRILSVDSIFMHATQNMWNFRRYKAGKPTFDSEKNFWKIEESANVLQVQVYRIFYVRGTPQPTEIGMVDFVPEPIDVDSSSGTSIYKFETVVDITDRASQWVSKNQDVQIVNLSAIPYSYSNAFFASNPKIKNRRTYHVHMTMGTTTTVDFLRVVYMKPGRAGFKALAPKTFVPIRKVTGQAERLSAMLARANQWLSVTGCRVAGVDTTSVPFEPLTKRPINPNQLSSQTSSTRGSYWITIIRLYLDGPYAEPSPDILPPAPDFDNSASSGCCVIS